MIAHNSPCKGAEFTQCGQSGLHDHSVEQPVTEAVLVEHCNCCMAAFQNGLLCGRSMILYPAHNNEFDAQA